MSLLMDALRKAEQEKREAARRQDPGAEPLPALLPTSTEITDHGRAAPAAPVETNEVPAVEGGLSLSPETELLPPPAAPAPEPAAVELAIEGIPPGGLSLQVEPVAPVKSAAPAAGRDEITQKMAIEMDLDTTFQGIDVTATAASVRGMYDETLADDFVGPGAQSRGLEDTLPGVSAVQLVRDIGGGQDQPTPVAAETVFSAGQKKSQTSPLYRWGLGAAAVLAILAAGVWHYFTVTPINRAMPSPWVARGIETTIAQPSDLLVPPPGLPAAGPGALEAAIAAGAVPSPSPDPAAAPTTVATAPTTPAATAVPASGTAAETPAPEIDAVPAPAATAPVAAAPEPETEQKLPAYIEPPPAIIIRRDSKPVDEVRLLNRAYESYLAGDFSAAKTHYQAALTDTPQNIDALAGLGAIALREGDSIAAADYFARVLLLDPRNDTAAAVLLGLQRDRDPVARESAVKQILQEFPDNAFLHFTLGNIYATQQRWADAQQAFFDAHRNDSGNPDYAMNLAVSLDRLGQSGTALDYYLTALKLTEERGASFDSAAVLSRIQDLQQATAP